MIDVETITFALAMAGFVALAIESNLAARSRQFRIVTFSTAAIVATHVLLGKVVLLQGRLPVQ
jgi:hypothetical protein